MDLDSIQWDNSATRTRRYRPTVRLVSYNGGSTTNAVFSKSAVAMILGHAQSCHVKIGLSGNYLIVLPCSAEELGAKCLEMRTDKQTKRSVAADDIGRKLNVSSEHVYEGEVMMEDRDTFRAELQKKNKVSRTNH